MKTTKMIIGIFFTVMSFHTFGNNVSVMPDNLGQFNSPQLGNFNAPSCDGADPSFTRVIIKPSCYGGNLRKAGNTLNPDDDISLQLTLTNDGQSFGSNIKFPAKIVWPKNYGAVCTWVNNGASTNSGQDNIVCTMSNININYKCSYKHASFFLSDELNCARVADFAGHAGLNKNILCTFMYNWKGGGFGATNSYSKIAGVARCGLQEPTPNYNVVVSGNTITPASINVSSQRGLIIADYNGLNIKKQSVIKNLATGELIKSGPRTLINANYTQNGSFITNKQQKSFDDYEQCLELKVAFLGGNRFCGSYYSPIMLFFDKNRPKFVGRSNFPLLPEVDLISWVEPKASGYFLAIDKSLKRKIKSGKQLFGEEAKGGFSNGFDKLKSFDDNHDDKINKKDKIFKSLFLWNDKNGNGVSEKDEVYSLKEKGIESISTLYNQNKPIQYGRGAEARQFGQFSYKKKGKLLKGEAIDIWFAPHPENGR